MDEAYAAQKQQNVAYRYNALMTAIEINRTPDGTPPNLDKVIADAKKINAFTQNETAVDFTTTGPAN